MAALTYTTLQSALLAAISKSQPPYNVVPLDFAQLYPQAIAYAEGRIYREMTTLGQRAVQTGTLTAVVPTVSLAGLAQYPLTIETFTIVYNGIRYPFDQATPEFIATINTSPGVGTDITTTQWTPLLWGWQEASTPTLILFPTPLAAYTFEIGGLAQQAALSQNVPTTFISSVYPDLMLAACMIFMVGALTHNFGAQSDDPRQAVSWESQFQTLLGSAKLEEARRRGLVPDQPSASKG